MSCGRPTSTRDWIVASLLAGQLLISIVLFAAFQSQVPASSAVCQSYEVTTANFDVKPDWCTLTYSNPLQRLPNSFSLIQVVDKVERVMPTITLRQVKTLFLRQPVEVRTTIRSTLCATKCGFSSVTTTGSLCCVSTKLAAVHDRLEGDYEGRLESHCHSLLSARVLTS